MVMMLIVMMMMRMMMIVNLMVMMVRIIYIRRTHHQCTQPLDPEGHNKIELRSIFNAGFIISYQYNLIKQSITIHALTLSSCGSSYDHISWLRVTV